MKKIAPSSVQLLSIKLLYFFTFASMASWLSLFYVYLKEDNSFNGVEIGVIAALQQISSVFIVPLWGMLADSFGRKRVFVVALSITILLFGGFYVSDTFFYFVGFILFFSLFQHPLSTLLDSITLDYVEMTPDVSYGEIRLWASIGWATASTIVGQMINDDNLYLIFIIAGVVLFCTWLVAVLIYKPIKLNKNIASLRLSTLNRLLIIDWRLTVTFAILLFLGVFSAPTHMFINIYYIEIGGSYQHIGIAYAVQAISELPFFFYGKKILDRFGTKQILVITIFVNTLRMLGYGVANDPWMAIAIGSMHGIGFGLFMVAIIDYVHRFVPPHLKATGQSFLYVFYFGAGISLGNMFTGWLKDIVGMQDTMLIQGGLSGILVVVAFFTVQLPKK